MLLIADRHESIPYVRIVKNIESLYGRDDTTLNLGVLFKQLKRLHQ